jgi:hypothetical protein
MLSKEELKEKKLRFWDELKKDLAKEKSSSGKRINWLSYPTEIKNIYLRLNVTKKEVELNFDIQFKDQAVREVFWEQMHELKNVLEQEIGTDGIWIENCYSEAVPIFSRIQWRKENLNYLNESDKQEIFDFFKIKMIAFDNFYQNFKEILLFLSK